MVKPEKQPYYCEQRQSWVVPLTQGHEAVIDEDFVDDVSEYSWYIHSRGYAATKLMGLKKTLLMHRLVAGTPPNLHTDHINGDKLDNRKSNLRTCTSRENHHNRRKHRNGGLVGASFNKKANKWMSQIRLADKANKYLGLFDTELEAHKRYMEEYEKISGL